MRSVYQTTNLADAHLVSDVLRQAGIDARVWGENTGPYAHPLGSVNVAVPDAQEHEARRLVAEWETNRKHI